MPAENKKFVIDDNSLFLLMLLKQGKTVTAEELDAIYSNDATYSGTLLNKKRANISPKEICSLALVWIEKEFNENAVQIKDFLNKYLEVFDPTDFFNEETHRKHLYDFVLSKCGSIEYANGKFFAHRFTPNAQDKPVAKYKMVEYICHLMNINVLKEGADAFLIDNDDYAGKLEKAIILKFKDAEQFFFDYLSEAEQIKRLSKTTVVTNGKLFRLYDDRTVENKSSKNLQAKRLAPRYFNILKYCIENPNGIMTEQVYKDNIDKNAKDRKTIVKYFSETNTELQSNFNLEGYELISYDRDNKNWKINKA